MILVKTGNGEGKTTSAIGLAIRAVGHGKKALIIQFLKDDRSGEVTILKSISGIEIVHPNHNFGFVFQMSEDQKMTTSKDCDFLLGYAKSSNADVIVLDEVLHALDTNLISRDKLEEVLELKKIIILTGYRAPPWVIDKADYVSDVQKIKHPYDVGIQSVEGIEF